MPFANRAVLILIAVYAKGRCGQREQADDGGGQKVLFGRTATVPG